MICGTVAAGTPRRSSESASVAQPASASPENARLTNPGPETSTEASAPPASPSVPTTRSARPRGGSPSCLASFMAKFACRSNPGWRAGVTSGSTSVSPVSRSIAAPRADESSWLGAAITPMNLEQVRLLRVRVPRSSHGSTTRGSFADARAAAGARRPRRSRSRPRSGSTPNHCRMSAVPSPQ